VFPNRWDYSQQIVQPFALPTSPFLKIIIVDFDTENDEATCGCNEICNEKRPKNIGFVENALQHEAAATYAHH
jgi:hypothetical protein